MPTSRLSALFLTTALAMDVVGTAQAEVAIGCRKSSDVPALREQVINQEGMIPVVSRFSAISETHSAE